MCDYIDCDNEDVEYFSHGLNENISAGLSGKFCKKHLKIVKCVLAVLSYDDSDECRNCY